MVAPVEHFLDDSSELEGGLGNSIPSFIEKTGKHLRDKV